MTSKDKSVKSRRKTINIVLIGITFLLIFLISFYFQMVDAAIPPTRAFDKITTSNGTIFAFNSSAKVNFVGVGGATITGSNNSKTVYISVTGGSGNMTTLGDAGDATIIAAVNGHILQYDGSQWRNELFKANTITCGGTDKFSAYNNATGIYTCTTDATGAGASDIISEGNSNVEVIDLGVGQVDVDIDGVNEFQFFTNLFDVFGATIDNVGVFISNSASPATAGTIRLGDSQVITWRNLADNNNHRIDFSGDEFEVAINSVVESSLSSTTMNLQGNSLTNADMSSATNTFGAWEKMSNVTDVGCATGQVRKVSGTNWICANDDTGGGTARENLVADWQADAILTNIGTTYNTVYDVANSNNEGIRIDTNGMSTSTIQIHWTKVGTGSQKCQVRDVANSGVLAVMNSLANGLNLNATQDIPTVIENTIKTYRIECKSTVAGDDPVFLHGQVLLR